MELRQIWRARFRGILGINRRNLEYVYVGNPRERFAQVDDKIRTKEILEAAGLPVPESLASLSRRSEIGPTLARLKDR